jgi:putative ABC transport system permease protein
MKFGGWMISGFSLLVGGFGEYHVCLCKGTHKPDRIQKSLGAKNKFILFQFLFEA